VAEWSRLVTTGAEGNGYRTLFTPDGGESNPVDKWHPSYVVGSLTATFSHGQRLKNNSF